MTPTWPGYEATLKLNTGHTDQWQCTASDREISIGTPTMRGAAAAALKQSYTTPTGHLYLNYRALNQVSMTIA